MLKIVLLLVAAYLIARWFQSALGGAPARRPMPPPPPRPPPPAASDERPPHEVLGVSPGATQEEIRAAYQRLVRENHPDRVTHMSREIQELAERRTKEINRAYDRLSQA